VCEPDESLLATCGGPRDHVSIPRAGLEVADVAKKEVTLRWPENELHAKGIAKQTLPGFVAALTADTPGR
jgi:hypothetical protein